MKRLFLLLALAPTLVGATDITVGGATYTLTDHPRVFLDGPAGTITTRVKDPDGEGAEIAPQATDLNPAYVALKAQVRTCRAAPTYCSDAYERATTVLLLALDWYMDNSQTESLTAAIYQLNNVESWIASDFQFGCDIRNAYCGISSWSDWPAWDMGVVSQAYSIVRSEMSAGERTTFAQKLLNDDELGYEDTCTNQLQQEVGATATFTAGSSAVTGTNLDGLTAGRRVYIKAPGTGAGGWGTISTVDSPTGITLTGAPQWALGGNATGVTGGQIHELKPWDDTTCGLAWMVQHHAYNPQSTLTGYVPLMTAAHYTIDATEVVVVDASALPSPPFYLFVPGTGEAMRVTNIATNTLTVDRAQLGTTATAGQFPPRLIGYSRYVPNLGTSEYAHNLIIHKIYGYLMVGLALADDSATAVNYAGWAADAWIANIYPLNRDMWTGFQQGGSTNYGTGRQLSENFSIVAALKNVPPGGEASLDKSAGTWLTQFTNSHLYTGLPGNAGFTIPWGQPDIASYSDYHAQMWAPFQTYLLGEDSDAAKHWNYMQRTVASLYTSTNLVAGSNERVIPYALMFWQEADTSTDYRSTIATEKAFTSVDGNATRALGSWVSRTGFSSSSDSLVYLGAFNMSVTQDHIGTGAPGAYKLYKSGWVLTENSAKDTGQGIDTNIPLFGGAANLKSMVQNQRVDIDKVDAGTGWALTRTNIVNAYTATAAATRALRYVVHFKKAASPDYLVVYDDMATSSAKTLGQNLHYDKTAGETSTIGTTLPAIEWLGPNRKAYTEVVLPAGTDVASTYTSLTNSHRVNLCASSDGSTCAAATSAEFLLVHRPRGVDAESAAIVALETIDSDYVGVQIEGTVASVAVFPKAGLYQTSASFTTTHDDAAQYVVTGLEAGIYDVVLGEETIVDDEAVGSDGTIAFESTAGAFTISRDGEVPEITITTTTLSNCVLNQPCSAQLAYEGGTPPVEWTKTVGDLQTGLTLATSGLISGTPTASGAETFTVQVEDALSATDTQELTLTVQTPPPTMTVGAQPGSSGVVLRFGTPGLDHSQSCDVVVSSAAINPETGEPIGPVASGTSTEGSATRILALTGLEPSTSHQAAVTGGVVASGSVSFTTRAARGGTVDWTYKLQPSAGLVARGATHARVSYNVVGEAADTVGSECETGCTLTLPLLSGQTYEIQHEWLTSQSVLYEYLWPDTSSIVYSTLVSVGPGVQLPDNVCGGLCLGTAVDLSYTNILVTFDRSGFFNAATFNGIHIADSLGVVPPYTSVTVNPATTIEAFDETRITFDDDNIFLNFQGFTWEADDVISVDVALTSADTTVATSRKGTVAVP